MPAAGGALTTWAAGGGLATVAPMSDSTAQVPAPPTAPFGSVFAGVVATATFENDSWSEPELGPLAPFSLHPATHVLHYGSACFEGLKAHRGVDGQVRLFRAAAHVARMRQSADLLVLPKPSEELLSGMMHSAVAANLDEVPAAPGSLYLRPTLIGTLPNIGAAAAPSSTALLYVLCSPVGDYFSGGIRPLALAIETEQPRTTPHFGMVKSGANYVMALGPTLKLKAELGIDQVLFCPGGEVQETGASNFMLIDAERVITPALTTSFLHGVTRDSILTIARDLGYQVEERTLTVEEVIEWSSRPGAEAALSGTAAVLSPVGTFKRAGETVTVGDGGVGEHTMRLRQALADIQLGAAPDNHGWTTLPS
jgi:branched-chain amino acid aminotransferase